MRESIIATVAAICAVLVAVPASAETRIIEQDGVRVAVVSYSDLNLATAEGTAALDARVDAAIDRVCEPTGFRDLANVATSRACGATARDAATSVKSLQLTRRD